MRTAAHGDGWNFDEMKEREINTIVQNYSSENT